MTSRKKKGLGLIVTGSVGIAAGVVLMTLTATPEWLTVAINIVAAVCNVVGLVFVAPDITSSD